MTQYLSPHRPSGLPALPELTLNRPTAAVVEAARRYVESASVMLELDGATLATNRPGAAPEELSTDLEYATAVSKVVPTSNDTAVAVAAPLSSATQVELDLGPEAHARKYVVGKLEIGRGNAVMNSQLLRSAAFTSPELGVPLAVVADRDSFEITLSGVSPTQDHADVLLFAVSLLQSGPDPKFGASVSFTTHQLLTTLGWAVNGRSYNQLREVIRDLSEIRLTYRDRADPRNPRVTEGERVFNSVTRPEQNALNQSWDIILPVSLFRIFELRRNTLVDLRARAALRSEFGRWLHGFVSSQRPGELRRYNAQEVCRAGGLHSTRLTDDLKILRSVLEVLERGEAKRQRARTADEPAFIVRTFDPVVVPGWKLAKDEGAWTLDLTRV